MTRLSHWINSIRRCRLALAALKRITMSRGSRILSRHASKCCCCSRLLHTQSGMCSGSSFFAGLASATFSSVLYQQDSLFFNCMKENWWH